MVSDKVFFVDYRRLQLLNLIIIFLRNPHKSLLIKQCMLIVAYNAGLPNQHCISMILSKLTHIRIQCSLLYLYHLLATIPFTVHQISYSVQLIILCHQHIFFSTMPSRLRQIPGSVQLMTLIYLNIIVFRRLPPNYFKFHVQCS